MQIDINYLAVLTAAIVQMALGAAWYSPALFGKQWMKASGMTDAGIAEAKKKGMTKSYVLNFIAALVMAYVLAHIVSAFGAATVAGGLQAGFWVWLGFVATVLLGTVLWELKPWMYYLINSAYYFVALLVAGAILAVWA